MRYRRFGKTELQIPVISCGGMRFQQAWNGDDPVSDESQQNVEACVRRALELGINHIETARGYGTSELQLGRVLPRLPRKEIIVQTKVNPDADVGKFTANFEKSMKLLQMDYLDLFAIHGMHDAGCIENTLRCLGHALNWKREGRIRNLGFSTHGPADIIIKAIETDQFDYVNLHWYYIFQDNWPAILEARKRDMGVFIISPNEKAGMLFNPSEKLLRLTAPLHPMVFNGLFCLAHSQVHTLSCGIKCPADFDLHMKTVERLDEAAGLVRPIERRLHEELARVFGDEWADSWHVGLPQWHETPGQINIPWILRLRNLVLALDMLEYGRMRYNLLGNGGHWFPGNKADKLSELDLTQCLKDSPHAAKIPDALKEAHAMLAGEERKRLQQEE